MSSNVKVSFNFSMVDAAQGKAFSKLHFVFTDAAGTAQSTDITDLTQTSFVVSNAADGGFTCTGVALDTDGNPMGSEVSGSGTAPIAPVAPSQFPQVGTLSFSAA